VVVWLIVEFGNVGGGGGHGVGSRRSGGRGRGGGRSGGSRGGGGGRGGCFDDTTTVWTKNETQSDEYATQVLVTNLIEGNLVGTININSNPNEANQFMWSRATDVTIFIGSYKAHSFEFSSSHHLTVTSAHLMIIWNDRIPYFVRADDVQVGDDMKIEQATSHVTKILNHTTRTKVSIETEDGTIQANGVLASGLCDHNPEVFEKVVKYEPIVKNYKLFHFGEEYNNMCMDSVSWRKSYMINNGFSA
jgi:hypothetical protein